MNEVLFFPIINEQGFKVVDLETYQHMINTIINAQIQLAEEYPDNPIIVYYEVGDGA